jgi:hypothetical protein
MIPSSTGIALSEVTAGGGREDAFRLQRPQILDTLTEVARVQSTESSNAIEAITAPHQRIAELVHEKTTPRSRSEKEIAGYRSVLDTIHASASDVPFKRSVVEQFHRDLYSLTKIPGGSANHIRRELRKLRDAGAVESPGPGRKVWRRLRDDF